MKVLSDFSWTVLEGLEARLTAQLINQPAVYGTLDNLTPEPIKSELKLSIGIFLNGASFSLPFSLNPKP